jgi:type II secretory pathway pseudopilin PulG
LPVQRLGGFTLVEIVLAVVIFMLLLGLAIPSLTGVLANRQLKRSLDEFNNLVRLAQEHSVAERRPYLIVWNKNNVVARPEVLAEAEEVKATAELALHRGEVLKLSLPAALTDKHPAEWIFWPSGTCEPATIQFTGRSGSWTANYGPLTARPQVTDYAPR